MNQSVNIELGSAEAEAWLNHLEPALGESRFFYEGDFAAMKDEKQALIAKAS